MLIVSLKGFGQLDTIKKPETIHIRLGRPTTNDNQPLYILDGKIVSAEVIQKMNPETIESMTILKDSAASYFCNRSNNGSYYHQNQKKNRKEKLGK